MADKFHTNFIKRTPIKKKVVKMALKRTPNEKITKIKL